MGEPPSAAVQLSGLDCGRQQACAFEPALLLTPSSLLLCFHLCMRGTAPAAAQPHARHPTKRALTGLRRVRANHAGSEQCSCSRTAPLEWPRSRRVTTAGPQAQQHGRRPSGSGACCVGAARAGVVEQPEPRLPHGGQTPRQALCCPCWAGHHKQLKTASSSCARSVGAPALALGRSPLRHMAACPPTAGHHWQLKTASCGRTVVALALALERR